ncbi:MAG: C1 family peptidase, partial [Myxococcota bacterium]
MITFRRADGSDLDIGGYIQSQVSDAIRLFSSSGSVARLPQKVDLRTYMTPIENQKHTSSCVANAVAGAYEYLMARTHGQSYDVSRLFIYYNGRSLLGIEDRDDGTSIAAAIDSLRQYGACSEETWPFREDEVNTEPDEEAYDEAAQFLIEDVARVPTELEAWKSCLAEGYPIIFGIRLYRSFDNLRRGVVPVPSDNEASRESHGGHAMLCVGYSEPDQMFIVRNSWGSGWGEQGYCYIPYTYLLDTRFNGGDTWMIRQIEELELDEELWDDDDTPMLEAVEHEFGLMSDGEFADLIDACGDVPIETRIALLMVAAAAHDGDLDDDEADRIVGFLEHTLEVLGATNTDAVAVLDYAIELYNEDDGSLVRE